MCCAGTRVARAGTGGIYSSAATVGWPRVRFALFIGRSRALAAGITWTSRTTSAPWAKRYGHTSVVDAAGAIYVIGGYSGGIADSYYQDVWASTDGGTDRTRAGGGRGVQDGYHGARGYRGGTTRVLHGVLQGYQGIRRCTQAYQRGTRVVLKGPLGSTQGAPRGYMSVSEDGFVQTRMSCISCLASVCARACVRVRASGWFCLGLCGSLRACGRVCARVLVRVCV